MRKADRARDELTLMIRIKQRSELNMYLDVIFKRGQVVEKSLVNDIEPAY